MLAAIAADEGERNAARGKRVGHATHRLAGEVRIKQRAVHHLALNGLQRVPDIGGGTDDGKPRLLENARDIERDEEFIFDDEDTCGRHGCICAFRSRRAPNRLRVHLIYRFRSRPSATVKPELANIPNVNRTPIHRLIVNPALPPLA